MRRKSQLHAVKMLAYAHAQPNKAHAVLKTLSEHAKHEMIGLGF